MGLLAAGCGRGEARERPDLLLLVVDALRPDHLGCYGYERATSPEIDALAARGALFERAQSAANYTTASVPAIFTGLFPSVHGVLEEGDRLHDDFTTLAERLRAAGYATAAFAPNPSLGRRFHFGQGFDLYDDRALRNEEVVPWRHFETAQRIQEGALRFADEYAGRPLFLYLHYRDVHGPYVPPPPFDALFANEAAGAARPLDAAERAAIPGYLRLPDDPATLDAYVAQYDGEIRYTDAKIAELLAALARRGRLERTWIVLTADHGESFLDHGVWNHGSELFQEEIHVPLIIVAPGARPGEGRRIATGATGVDLLPTLLELAGLPAPAGIQGRSLAPLLAGARWVERPLFAEGRQRIAVRLGDWKLLRNAELGRFQLFDLRNDPGERIDVATARPDAIDRLGSRARRFLASSRALAAAYPRETVPLDAELERELRALGYLQ